eukprot:GHVL01024512.1.p1 GENE.GHVL01024512.1~~GHVL01024512.1.p1  ORF type:complete len:773 (+),score=94.31 GHVL01024512.1:237-2555(+)
MTFNVLTHSLSDCNSDDFKLLIDYKSNNEWVYPLESTSSDAQTCFESQSKILTSMDAKYAGRIGLVNLGDTCFMNAALQCLAHIMPLTTYFLNERHKEEINESNPLGYCGKLIEAYCTLLQAMWTKAFQNTPYRPSQIKNLIGRRVRIFAGYNQQDSQELLSVLLDGLHEDVNRVVKKPVTENPEDIHDTSLLANLTWKVHLLRNDSIVVDLFQGLYQSNLNCPRCNHTKLLFDPCMYFSVPLPAKQVPVRVTFLPLNCNYKIFKFGVLVAHGSNLMTLKSAILKKVHGEVKDEGELLVMINPHEATSIKIATSTHEIYACNTPEEVVCYGMSSHNVKSIEDFYSNDNFFTPMGVSPSAPPCIPDSQLDDCQSAQSFTVIDTPSPVVIPSDVETPPGTITPTDTPPTECATEGVTDSTTLGLPVFNNSSMSSSRDDSSWVDCSFSDLDRDKRIQHLIVLHRNPVSESSPKHYSFAGVPEIFSVDYDRTTCSHVHKQVQARLGTCEGKNKFSILHGSFGPISQTLHVLPDDDSNLWETIERASGPHVIAEARKLPFIVVDTEEIRFWDIKEDESWKSCIKRENHHSSHEIDIKDCFRLFCEKEVLGNDDRWYCGECKTLVRATKQIQLWRMPFILIVHLKRFQCSHSGRRRKIVDRVRFPVAEELDMSSLLSEEAKKANPNEAKYKFVASVNHYGSDLSSGHYIAICRLPPDGNGNPGELYTISDSNVSITQQNDCWGDEAYLLFYQRIDKTSPGKSSDECTIKDLDVSKYQK